MRFCRYDPYILVRLWVYLDKDVSNIMLRKFHETEDDIHPSITLCRKDPFDYYLKSTIVDNDEREQNDILLLYANFISGVESENFPFDIYC